MKSKGTAVVTGATSGIGAEFARQLARQGYDLIITGRRKEEIKRVSEDIAKTFKGNVEVILAELSESSGVDKVLKALKKKSDLKMLVNNAGFGVEGFFHKVDFQQHEKMLMVHALAVMKLTYEAIPLMIKNGQGAVINVASIAGKVYVPAFSIYNATKAFLIAFTETLHMELKKDNIKVQALCPGFTRTDFHQKIGYGLFELPDCGLNKWMVPEKVVEISLKSLEKNKVVCIPGFLNKLSYKMQDWFPRKTAYSVLSNYSDYKTLFKLDKKK